MGDTKRGRERKGRVKARQRRTYEIERELRAADEPPESDDPEELRFSFESQD